MRLERNHFWLVVVTLPALLVTLASFFFLLTNERRSDLKPVEEFNSLGIAAQVAPGKSGISLEANGTVYVSPLRALTNGLRWEISEQAEGDAVSPWKMSALKNFAQPTPFGNAVPRVQSQGSTPAMSSAQPLPEAPAPVEPSSQPQAANDDNSGKSDDDNSGKSDDDNSGKSDDDDSGKSDDDDSGKSGDDEDNSGHGGKGHH